MPIESFPLFTANLYIPKPLEAACSRSPERFMIKAPHFINGYSGEYAPEQPLSSINALPKGVSNSS